MATHTFQIIVTQSGAQQTAQAIAQVGASAQKSANALQFFRQALVVASTIRAAAGMVDLIDAATRIDNRLRVATKSASEFARAQQFISQVSRETRTDIEANAVTYARLLRSTDSLGLSSQFLEKVMKGLALSVKVGGATSMEARNSLVQFSQSLASGALRGDELRSVAEQLPALAEAIGREFGVSGGQLLAFAKANPGILETERVIKAVAAAVPDLEKEAAKMVPTIAEGFIAIKNGAIEMLGTINRSTGIFGAFSRALVIVGQNLGTVLIALGGIAAARYASVVSGWLSITTGFTSALVGNAKAFGALLIQVRSLSAMQALMSMAFSINPVTAIIVAITAFIAIIVALYDKVDVVKIAVDNFFLTLSKVSEVFGNLYEAIAGALPAWVTWDSTMKAVGATIAVIVQAMAILISLAIVPVERAIVGLTLILNQFGAVSDETARKVVEAAAGYETFVRNLIMGTTSTKEAGTATEQLTEKSKGLLSGLLGASSGANSAKTATSELADAVKRADENSALFVAGKFINDGSWSQGSVEGFNNLARVTKDWEKYTTDAGTAVTSTASATQAAKAPTDALGGSMKAVNTQASGAATASRAMATAMNSSAESSTTAAKQIKEMADLMKVLNPLLIAAKAAGEAAAAGFRAAGQAAASAVGGVNQLIEAYKRLAAAKAAAGQSSNSSGGVDGERAAGGPVLRGNTYLVGEKGPELFTPGATGNIIPNHALMSGGTTAANDNTVLIVKAINRMANAVVASNKVAAKTNEEVIQEIAVQNQLSAKTLNHMAVAPDQSTSFRGTGYSADGRAFENDPNYNWKAYGESQLQYGMNYNAGSDAFGQLYTDPGTYAEWMKDNKILGGDEQYRANMQEASNWTLTGGWSGTYDANKPYDAQNLEASAKLAMLKASLERYGIDAFAYSGIDIMGEIKQQEELVQYYVEKSQAATDALKKYRDEGANFEQFQKALPEMAKVQSKIQDFQTYTPMQGGKDYGFNDPYGIGNAPRPNEDAQAAMASAKTAGAQDNRVQVQMTVNTPNAESFRQNKAQIESQVASMVDRANRRAGRK